MYRYVLFLIVAIGISITAVDSFCLSHDSVSVSCKGYTEVESATCVIKVANVRPYEASCFFKRGVQPLAITVENKSDTPLYIDASSLDLPYITQAQLERILIEGRLNMTMYAFLAMATGAATLFFVERTIKSFVMRYLSTYIWLALSLPVIGSYNRYEKLQKQCLRLLLYPALLNKQEDLCVIQPHTKIRRVALVPMQGYTQTFDFKLFHDKEKQNMTVLSLSNVPSFSLQVEDTCVSEVC